MSRKKQSKNKIRKSLSGFLFIECLIALLIASWLMVIFAVVQKKNLEGQHYIRKQFAVVHAMSSFLHTLMLKSKVDDIQNMKQGTFSVSSKPEQYRIVATSYPAPWITSKKLPVKPITITLKDNQGTTNSITTAVLT